MKKKCRIDECRPGDIIAEDIYTEAGQFIIPANTEANEYILEKIRNFGIATINIVERVKNDENASVSAQLENLIIKDYRKNVKKIKTVLNGLASGRKLDIETANEVAESVYNDIYSNFGILECLNRVRTSDEYTYTHCLNVSIYSMFIARWLGFEKEKVKEVVLAGLLHDVGKAKIPLTVLNKKGPLTPQEFELIKKHSTYGYDYVKNIDSLSEDIKNAVLMHHEKENGTGYPLGVTGEKIGLYAKIVAVADIYDALTSERIYRPKLTPFDTFKEIEKVAVGTGLYDLKIILPFLSNISVYYTGAKVRMNDGSIGTVVYVPPHNISTPVVQLEEAYVDLKDNSTRKIVAII